MSFEKRTVENLLLKERRNLIDHEIERRFIKIHGNSIYVKNKLHGLVQDSKFCLATDINALSTDMTLGADIQFGTLQTTPDATTSNQITSNPDIEPM